MKRILLGLLIVMGFSIGGGVSAFSELAPPTPDFTVSSLSGEVISNKSLAGKPTLLMFWASWCGVCQGELPKLKALYEENNKKGLAVLAVGVHDKQSNIIRYVANHSETFTFPVAYDSKNKMPETFGIRGVPKFVLLDKEGNVLLTHTGGGFMQNPDLAKFLQAF
jgi:thiol-disulfide isomerase/thioredoxin